MDTLHRNHAPAVKLVTKPQPGSLTTAAEQGPRPTFWITMTKKVDAKAAEMIELRKGTIWAIGIAPAVIGIFITLSVMLVGYGRADQAQTEQINMLRESLVEMKAQMRTMNDQITEVRIQQSGVVKMLADGRPTK